jgi:hypothetical protein
MPPHLWCDGGRVAHVNPVNSIGLQVVVEVQVRVVGLWGADPLLIGASLRVS